jgi:signal transduction histidine kinase
VRRSPLGSYEGQIKVFLVLLVLFLAVAIYFNFHLLVVARNAIQDEVERRLALQADLVRAELERDQMLRGLRAAPGSVPYIPPTFLDRMARLKGMRTIEILNPQGTVLSSSDPARVGAADAFLARRDGAPLRRLSAGGTLVTPLDRLPGSGYSTLSAYRPVEDRARIMLAIIRVEEEVPVLASVDLNLKTIASLQAGGLAFVLVLVVLFARWLLQPYRRLLLAAGEAPGALPGLAVPGGAAGEPDYLVAAFQGVLDTLRKQEQELSRLKQERAGDDGGSPLPGDRLIGGMTSAVLVFDPHGRLRTLNAAAERLLGGLRAAVVGRRPDELFGGNGKLIDLIAKCLATGEGHSREVVSLAGVAGRVAHLGAMVSPIRSGADQDGGAGHVEGALCLLADLTEIKSLRERVGLKENLASLGEMSAGIAHEFRNSLAAIQGLARLIARQGGDRAGGSSGGRENAEAILREVGGIQKVVDDFLRFARPATLDLGEIDLRGLVSGLVEEFRADPLSRGIEVAWEGEFPRIVADETLVRQALQNLLRNAAESFGTNGGPAPPGPAGVGPGRRIVLRGAVEDGPGGGARIIVEDNGCGIPPADLPHVFTPFYTTKDRGTGLGLALVQKTAVVHDGRVDVESEAGRGSRFALVLPARPGSSPPPGPL